MVLDCYQGPACITFLQLYLVVPMTRLSITGSQTDTFKQCPVLFVRLPVCNSANRIEDVIDAAAAVFIIHNEPNLLQRPSRVAPRPGKLRPHQQQYFSFTGVDQLCALHPCRFRYDGCWFATLSRRCLNCSRFRYDGCWTATLCNNYYRFTG